MWHFSAWLPLLLILMALRRPQWYSHWMENLHGMKNKRVCVYIGGNSGRHPTLYKHTTEPSPSLSFRYFYIVHDRRFNDRFGLNSAAWKNRPLMEDIALFQTTRHVAARNCRKLIGAAKQLVIFVLADSLINCRCGHLDHLSCLSEPRFITVREARDGKGLLCGRATAIVSVFSRPARSMTLICDAAAALKKKTKKKLKTQIAVNPIKSKFLRKWWVMGR